MATLRTDKAPLCGTRILLIFIGAAALSLRLTAEDDIPKGGTSGVLTGESMAESLKMLALQTRANYESMRTLTARYEFADKFYFHGSFSGVLKGESAALSAPDGYWEIVSGELAFEWDAKSEEAHILYKPTKPLEYLQVDTGKSIVRTNAGDMNVGDIFQWILTPEHWIEFGGNVRLGQMRGFPDVPSVPPTGGRIVTRRARGEGDRFLRVVQPRDFFSNGSQLFWQQLEWYSDALAGKRSADEKQHLLENVELDRRMDKGESEFILTVKYPARGEAASDILRVETTFDSSVGFQPTLWVRLRGKDVAQKRTFAYKRIGDVFVPKLCEYARYESISPGRTIETVFRKFALQSATVNEPIPERRFGSEQFGLKYGERMLDEIENQLYVMDEHGFVPVEKFKFDSTKLPSAYHREEKTSASGQNWSLLVLNVLVVTGLLVTMVYRARKSRV